MKGTFAGDDVGLYLRADGCDVVCQFSYSGFNEFRKKIALSLGFDLEDMKGFCKKHPIDEKYVKIGCGSWENIKSPLRNLLNHSDCEGVLTSEECKIIAPVLKTVVSLWEDLNLEYYKEQGIDLVALMEYCGAYDKELIFC